MRVSIFGATGLLGKALMREWHGDAVTGLGSKDVDIRSEHHVLETVTRTRPEWIVLAAAYTDVDGCESHRDLAFAVNVQGAVNVAKAAKAVGSRLLFLSSDYVFDGRKTTPYETEDVRAPQSVYGTSKAQAEEQLIGMDPNFCIVRTSWVFGTGGKCFPDTILKLAATRKELDVVNDQRGCPTYTVDLARAIRQLCHACAEGIVHVTNAEDCTWFDLATELLRVVGSDTVVRPTTTEKFPRPAQRPKYSVLSATSRQRYGIQMPHWKNAVARYLEERKQSSG